MTRRQKALDHRCEHATKARPGHHMHLPQVSVGHVQRSLAHPKGVAQINFLDAPKPRDGSDQPAPASASQVGRRHNICTNLQETFTRPSLPPPRTSIQSKSSIGHRASCRRPSPAAHSNRGSPRRECDPAAVTAYRLVGRSNPPRSAYTECVGQTGSKRSLMHNTRGLPAVSEMARTVVFHLPIDACWAIESSYDKSTTWYACS